MEHKIFGNSVKEGALKTYSLIFENFSRNFYRSIQFWAHERWLEKPLLLERSGTYYVAMVTKLYFKVLNSYCGAHLLESYLFIYYDSQRFPITVNVHVKEAALLNVT